MLFVVALLLSLTITGSVQAQKASASAPVLLSIDENGFDALRAQSKGRVLLLNFWATWCKPCVEEFPDLVELQQAYAGKGLDVVFISIDDDARARQKVTAFLRKMNVVTPSYIKETHDDEKFINAVSPRWSGALPATFVYDRRGNLASMNVEELTKRELENIILPLLMNSSSD
jgi:thiol-disulfide isomerase/thioredoxin